MGMTDLLNCPFCGGDAWVGSDTQYVECQKCDALGPDGGAAAWNTRADIHKAEIERLRARAKELEAAHDQAMKGWDIAQTKEIDATARAEAAEAEIEGLRAEVKELEAAANQARLAFAGYVSVQSAINMLDATLGGKT